MAAPQASTRNLESVAERDATVRPLALMQIAALQTAEMPAWQHALDGIQPASTVHAPNVPLLHDSTLPVDVDALRDLVQQLTATAGNHAHIRDLDPLTLLHASVTRDLDVLIDLADALAVPPAALVTIAHHAALPLLHTAGARLSQSVDTGSWQAGYCPICGDWPTLAELRGLERSRWLRCGRCAGSWGARLQQCTFCGNLDHTTLGYLAGEDERESRRAVTCQVCHGYLKSFATITPLSHADILERDLTSLELDVAALDAGYGRPERPGFDLSITFVKGERADASNGRRWWRR